MLRPCPGCQALLDGRDGPTHPYIGASPACWDVYTRLLAGDPPIAPGPSSVLMVDAYAAQHPGDASRRATQSVAVHLIALQMVLGDKAPTHLTVPIRVAAVETARARRGFPKLDPVPEEWPLTVVDVAGGAHPSVRAALADEYVNSVLEAWWPLHGPQIEEWARAVGEYMGLDQS